MGDGEKGGMGGEGGFCWVSVGSVGFRWDFSGSQWDLGGSQRGADGFQWVPIGFLDSDGIGMGSRGIDWGLGDSSGFQWDLLCSQGIPVDPNAI